MSARAVIDARGEEGVSMPCALYPIAGNPARGALQCSAILFNRVGTLVHGASNAAQFFCQQWVGNLARGALKCGVIFPIFPIVGRGRRYKAARFTSNSRQPNPDPGRTYAVYDCRFA